MAGRGRGRGRGAPNGNSSPPGVGAPAPASAPPPAARPPAARPPAPAQNGVARGGGDPTAAVTAGVQNMALRAPRGGGGAGAAAGGPRRRDDYPVAMIRTRPANLATKEGVKGKPIELFSNYVEVQTSGSFRLYQHHVEFKPELDHTGQRRRLLVGHKDKIGKFQFDGAVLHTFHSLGNEEEPLVLRGKRDEEDETEFELVVKFVKVLPSTDPHVMQVFGSLVRKFMEFLNLQMVGQRGYFYDMDPARVTKIAQHGLEIASGFITGIRQHETQLLLNIFSHHKVMRTETVFDAMKRTREEFVNRGRPIQELADELKSTLVGEVVITRYNSKTYRVDDIDMDRNPESIWNEETGETYAAYYKRCYGIEIRVLKQPLLVTRPKIKDRRRGATGPIYLIPEVCNMTGLSDKMRSDFTVMRSVADITRMKPAARVEAMNKLVNNLHGNEKVNAELENFKLRLGKDLVKVRGRVLDPVPIRVKAARSGPPQLSLRNAGDWQTELRDVEFHRTAALQRLHIIHTKEMTQAVAGFIRCMERAAQGFKVPFKAPAVTVVASNTTASYAAAVNDVIARQGNDLDLIICVFPDNKADRYSTFKRMTYVDNAIPSQAVVMRTIRDEKKVMSVASKILQQMVVKVGGALWNCGNIPPNTMIAGFDVYHDTQNKKRSAGALICSLDGQCTAYSSHVAFHETPDELSNNMGISLVASLKAYQDRNKVFPDRMILYRDGVGEGQISYVVQHEVAALKKQIESVGAGTKLTVILVSKRIHSQFFTRRGNMFDNPPPGTVIDNTVTNNEMFDFFLIPQASRQGTVNPVMFNVIEDGAALGPDNYQFLSYLLSHLYYNWSGSVRVPAPVQYAHKLAFLAGESLHRKPHASLSDKLFYL